MPSPKNRDRAPVPPASGTRRPIRYGIEQRQQAWYICFDGTDYGPYLTQREAMLFAVDAAKNLGEQGEATQVLVIDGHGHGRAAWTFGCDPYPPRL